MNFADLIQAIVALLTVAGLGVTVVYNQRALRVSRQESMTGAFLSLNERLQETLYGLLELDSNILKESDVQKLKAHQFRFFRLFDIFADMYQMKPMLEEFDPQLWARSEARIRQIARKQAVATLWHKQLGKNAEIFDDSFQRYMAEVIGVAEPALGA